MPATNNHIISISIDSRAAWMEMFLPTVEGVPERVMNRGCAASQGIGRQCRKKMTQPPLWSDTLPSLNN